MTSPTAGGFPTVGFVGAGQLARMMQPAAINLGIRLRVLADTADDSAAQVIPDVHLGDYRDLDTLRRFAHGCDVVTVDHEHVPTEHLRALHDAGVAVRPGPHALVHTQDKGVLRRRLDALGVAQPGWRAVDTMHDVQAVAAATGGPGIHNHTRGGYDGKGVWAAPDAGAAADVVRRAADRAVPLLAEERVDFTRELAAVVARGPSGQAAAYPVVETVQVDGICREVVAPAPIDDARAVAAQQIALRLAGELDVVGVLAVELFDSGRGSAGGLLVNELAMRPHNSAHWTIDGATTSQFEQHLRAVLDLPLGNPMARAPLTVMVNVLGGDYPDLYSAYRHILARDPGLRVHLYGKEVKPGRKIGHVTATGTDRNELLERGRHAAGYLRGDILE